jgi:hypothetical protein
MLTLVNRLFRLQNGEAGLVLSLGFILLGNSLAFQVSGIVAISGFLSEGGLNQIPLVLLVDYVLILLTAALQTLVVDRWGRVTLVKALTFGFALLFLLLRLMFVLGAPGWLNYSVMYIVAEQQWVTFPLLFWILANDVLDMAQTKRLFPLIASWGFVGKLLGIGVAAFSPAVLARLNARPEEVLSLNVLIYLLAYAFLGLGLRGVKVRATTPQHETVRETLSEGWGFVREVPSFRYLMLSVMVLALCDTIIEFRFLAVTDALFPQAADYQRFYSLYRLGSTLLGFVMQGFLTSRLINSLNLKNVFLLLPLVVFSSAVWMLGLPGLVSAVGGIMILKLVRDTTDESARKSFQALVPEERRGRVSTFMDSYLPALGTLLGCLILLAVIHVGLRTNAASYFYVYLSIAAAGAAFSVWAILKMRTVYDSSLFNWRLKRRQRGGRVLDQIDF